MTKAEVEVVKKKQLIIFINPLPNEDMANRVKLFTSHAITRGEVIKTDNYACMITKKTEGIDVSMSDVTQTDLIDAPEFQSIIADFQAKNLLKSLTDAEKGNIDHILIISTGVGSVDSQCFERFNGIEVPYHPALIKNIQNIIDTYAKNDGMVRVQICHSGTKKVVIDGEEKIFSEVIKPAGKDSLKISAPPRFSVISENDGRAVDVQITDVPNFKFFAGQGRKYLNKVHGNVILMGFFNNYIAKEANRFKSVLKEAYLISPDGAQEKIELSALELI